MPENKNPKTALVLEDEPIICKILMRTLKMDGMEADIAQNGQIAKEKIDAGNKYDLLIFDIRTPIISGIQLFEYLEKKHRDLTKKVVFTTGDCLSTATNSFLERANRPYIIKPYTPVQIKSLIKQVLSPELAKTR